MRVLACYKWVYDERDLRIDAADLSLRCERAARKISDYDLNAIEAALQVKEAFGAEAWLLTVGGPAVEGSVKDALSRGADGALVVSDPALEGAGPLVTSQVIASVIRQVQAFDLVLFGEGASDDFAQQVGPRVAQLLDLPVITYAAELTVADGHVRARRRLENGDEEVQAPLPAVVCVTAAANRPRIPGMKQIIAAGKKPVTRLPLDSLGLDLPALNGGRSTAVVRGNVQTRRRRRVEGEPAEAAAELLRLLMADGLIRQG